MIHTSAHSLAIGRSFNFAAFDIDNKIQRTGLLTKFEFHNPHVMLELEVQRDDGSMETWMIESGAPRRWAEYGLDVSVASVGEEVTILGRPARGGTDVMVLSTIITKRGTTVFWAEIEQKRARDNIPDVTIRREWLSSNVRSWSLAECR